jgi:hypothetical protein
MKDRGIVVRFLVEIKDFSFLYRAQVGFWAHLASYPKCTEGSFIAGRAAGAWNWHSPPSDAEAKNAWSCTSIPPNVFMIWCLTIFSVKRFPVFNYVRRFGHSFLIWRILQTARYMSWWPFARTRELFLGNISNCASSIHNFPPCTPSRIKG